MKKMMTKGLGACALLLACVAATNSFAGEAANFRKAKDVKGVVSLESGKHRFLVKKGLEKDLGERAPLWIGVPTDLDGENFLFGAVITKVSDRENEELGNMKLAAFNIPARADFAQAGDARSLQIWSKPAGAENAPHVLRLELPVLEMDTANRVAYVDMAAAADKLDFYALYRENARWGDETSGESLRPIASRTVAVDFTDTTFVFDIETDYEVIAAPPEDGSPAPAPARVTFTTRWFLRLNSVLSGSFVPRAQTPGVGFFTNSRDDSGFITRFAIDDLVRKPVKYYIKNVPTRYLPAFTASFDDWNDKLESTLGGRLLSYDIIPEGDPRGERIVAGDIRYNVLEWDLVNNASYGGLGPSLYHPLTGQTLAAQTLIQGPMVEQIYKAWFRAEKDIDGKPVTDRTAFELFRAKEKQAKKTPWARWGGVPLVIPGADPRLADPIAANPMDFISRPDGYDYDAYMYGYFRDMVAHELGHNLGLRHNFRSSLGDNGSVQPGSVSRSIMEYLGRAYRYLNRVGEYDVMAVAYGYLGTKPAQTGRFCTDENQGVYDFRNSAECSSGDATADPYAYLESRLAYAMDLLVARGSPNAPDWTAGQLWGATAAVVNGIAAYAATAPATGLAWSNFANADRPSDSWQVPAYVLGRLNTFVCGASLEAEAEAKPDPEAKSQTRANIAEYRALFFEGLKQVPAPWNLVSSGAFECIP